MLRAAEETSCRVELRLEAVKKECFDERKKAEPKDFDSKAALKRRLTEAMLNEDRRQNTVISLE